MELYPLLSKTHSEVHPLVGTDLSRFALADSPRFSPSPSAVTSSISEKEMNEAVFKPVYSQISDHVTQGENQVFSGAKGKVSSSFFFLEFFQKSKRVMINWIKTTKIKLSLLQVHHFEFDAVEGPTSIEVVVQFLPSPVEIKSNQSQKPAKKLWKLVRYFDDPATWSHPGQRHEEIKREGLHIRGTKVIRHEPLKVRKIFKYFCFHNFISHLLLLLLHNLHLQSFQSSSFSLLFLIPKDQFELYNLTDDPLEVKNLAHPDHHPLEPESELAWNELRTSLISERSKKALKTRNPLPKQPHKHLPVFVTKSQANDTLSEAVMKILGSFPNPELGKPLPYPKLWWKCLELE